MKNKSSVEKQKKKLREAIENTGYVVYTVWRGLACAKPFKLSVVLY